MKAHVAFLALSVLCLEAWLGAPGARAQVPLTTEAPPVAGSAAPAPLEPPSAIEALPTPVDTQPPTAVHVASPAVPAGPPPILDDEAPPRPRSALERFGAPRHRDAHVDRLLFAPTAETHPRGAFYATSYYIVLLQLGYALTDDTQLSVTATPPLGDEGVIPGDISLKTVLLRAPRVTVAAIGSASGIVGFEEVSGFLGRAGGVVTFCADPEACRLSFSMSSNVALAGPASLLFNGVGVSYRAGRIVSLIAELDTLIPLAEPVGEANGLLGGAGIRLSGAAWGVDLALMRAGKARAEPSGFFPFLAASYRYLP
jgi:hypothetical protein